MVERMINCKPGYYIYLTDEKLVMAAISMICTMLLPGNFISLRIIILSNRRFTFSVYHSSPGRLKNQNNTVGIRSQILSNSFLQVIFELLTAVLNTLSFFKTPTLPSHLPTPERIMQAGMDFSGIKDIAHCLTGTKSKK